MPLGSKAPVASPRELFWQTSQQALFFFQHGAEIGFYMCLTGAGVHGKPEAGLRKARRDHAQSYQPLQ